MKKLLILICFIVTVVGCTDVTKNTQKAVEWVNGHPRPIVVTSNTQNGITLNYRCMFQDASGCIYYAGEIEGFQPDTIQ
jgi:uncharacterized protein YcfL